MLTHLANITNLKRCFAGKQKLCCQVELLHRGGTEIRVPDIELRFGRNAAGSRKKAVCHADRVSIRGWLGPVLQIRDRHQEGWVLRHAQPSACTFRVICNTVPSAKNSARSDLPGKAYTRHKLVIVRIDQITDIAAIPVHLRLSR